MQPELSGQNAPALAVRNISVAYPPVIAVRNVSLEISGGVFGILGPNGAGKSTLLKAMAGLEPLSGGEILLFGTPLATLKAKDRAKKIAFVPQEEPALFDFTVEEVVMMGRTIHLDGLRGPRDGDWLIVDKCIALADLTHLRSKPITRLSGGEHRRALLARALAQQTPLLLMDEPTAHLDVSHQTEFLRVAKEAVAARGGALVVVLHDLNIAAGLCDRVALLNEGVLAQIGQTSEVLNQTNLKDVFGWEFDVMDHPDREHSVILPATNRTVQPAGSAPSGRYIARQIFDAAVGAVLPQNLISNSIQMSGDNVSIGDKIFDFNKYKRIVVAGAGKASAAMAQALESILGDRINSGLVVTKTGHSVPCKKIEIIEASHPVPDETSQIAGARILELLSNCTDDDLVIFLLSGGASALMESTVDDISLEDLQNTNRLLLNSGASISEINPVRSCLSRVKAGGLRRATQATVICLILSDVLGNDLNVIGSGPFSDTSPNGELAEQILRDRGIWDQVPASVRDAVHKVTRAKPADTNSDDRVHQIIIGDLNRAIDAAAVEAQKLGLKPWVVIRTLDGEARDAGKWLGELAASMSTNGSPGMDVIIAGGETTVTVTESGVGGRSQELATAAALALRGVTGITLLAGGTDGTDGPTDAAGAVVDGSTAERAEDLGISLHEALTNNNAYPALEKLGELLITGPTGTNVADLVVIVRG